MNFEDLGLSADGQLQITQTELDYLEKLLDANDRAGFYIAYYNMTGNNNAILQAQIATFSESVGGIAYVANTSSLALAR